MALMRKIIPAVLIFSLLSACDLNPPSTVGKLEMKLTPLSPFSYEFSGQAGKSRNDYYFTPVQRDDPTIKETIGNLVKAAMEKSSTDYERYSIYVYEQTDMLNGNYAGSADDLRGVYDNNLISYARWNKGALDVFYYIESGNVVYDLLNQKPVSPSWEFD